MTDINSVFCIFVVKIRTNLFPPMTHKEQIEKHGYCIFSLTKATDDDSITPISTKYQAIILCQEGEAIIEANMQQAELKKDDCRLVNNVLYKKTISMSDDFQAKVLISERSYALNAISGLPAGYLELLYANPHMRIEDSANMELIAGFFNILEVLQTTQLTLRHNEVASNTFRSLILTIAGLKGGNMSKSLTFNQSDVYFRRFLELIDTHINHEHEVNFYANELHISAKYLSEVCKKKSGHNAKEMISYFLISKIKQEILMSGKSIKTIAYDYGFSDQSSMGKFFNKMTGNSPGEFKKNSAQV